VLPLVNASGKSWIVFEQFFHKDDEHPLQGDIMSLSVEGWLANTDEDEWSQMMRKVAAFHHKHDLANKNGHDMGYRIALTVEELGELAAAITKGKPIEECAEEMADLLILLMGHSLAMKIDLKASFESKYERIMQRSAITGRLGVRVTEYKG
jgi:NTP pyrophosphatase (non-canonical NTP hydrolase)